MHYRRMYVGNVVSILDSMKSQFIRRTMHDSFANPAPCQGNRKSIGMVVSAIGALRTRCSAKFSRKHHQCFIQKPSLFEICYQTGNRFVYLCNLLSMPFFQIAMRVPGPGPAVTSVKNLHEARSCFDQSTGHQTLSAKRIGRSRVDSI